MIVPGLQATPALASDPLTFDHIAGAPRHQTPEDVAIDGAGNVYVAESGAVLSAPIVGDRVTKYDADGTFLDVLAGPGSATGQVANPVSVAVAPNGNIYVLENGQPASGAPTEVSYFDPLGNQLGAWGAYGTGIGEFKTPSGIAVDSVGNVYVADWGNDRVQKFSSTGVGLASWGVSNILDVDIDATDTVWTTGANTVARWTSGGSTLNSWGASGATGVVVAADGTAWISGGGSIRHYDASSNLLATISGLSTPEGLDITSDGTLYVADSVTSDTQSGQIDVYTTSVLETSWSVTGVTGVALDGSTVLGAGGGNVGKYSTSGAPGASWTSNGAHSVAPDGAGNYWVSSSADGVVREYDATGSLVTTIGSGELSTPKGVAFAGGKVFVADPGANKIFRFDQAGGASETSWTVTGVVGVAVSGTTVYATDGSNVRTYSTAGAPVTSWGSAGSRGIAIDGSGNVWVSSSGGVVRSYTSVGGFRLTVGAGVLTDPVGVAVSGSKLYVADNGANKIKRFSTTNTYQFEWGQYPGPGVEDYPSGVAVDAGGTVYVTNKTQDLVQKYDATGAFVGQIGGSGSANGLLSSPEAVAVAPGGDIYVADTGNNRIERFTSAGAYVSWWGGLGTQPGTFDHPAGIAFDGAGNIYVSDTGNDRIQKFDSGMNYLTSWGGYGTGTSQFKSPQGVTVYAGSLWIADSGNNRISKFSTGGAFQAVLGSSGNTDGKLSSPFDVAVDAEGTIWVADRSNNRIQRLTTTGSYLSKLGTKGLDSGQFDSPEGIEIDGAGHVLVADTNNHRVQVFIDANGPDVTFLTGPGTATKLNTATFTFTANEPGSTFECKLDAAVSWASCVSGVTYSALAEATHTLAVRATDSGSHTGNPTPYTWAVDTTAPTVSMTQAPVSPSASTSPSFSFVSSEPTNATYLCKLDAAAAAACTSPKTVAVTNGSHTFKVWTTDAAGNQSTLPATHTWTVDTTPPTVTIDSGPTGFTAQTSATFTFSSDSGTDTFECHIDGLAYAPCTSSATYPGLSAAQHTFYVRGTDVLGNISAEKTRKWTVDLSDHRPDAWLSTGTTYVGNNVYNATGTNQTKTQKKPVNVTATFTIRFENDGDDTDTYTIKGGKSATGYAVTYWIGTTSYTTKVTAGTMTITLSPGEYKILTMRVKVSAGGKASAGFLVSATSGHEPSKSDAVKAVVKRV